jgi:UDP-glucuronate 4-epimerase
LGTYLVTGCAGFIGSHLAEALLARGHTVVGVDAFTDYYARGLKEANVDVNRSDVNFRLFDADLAVDALDALFENVRWDLSPRRSAGCTWQLGRDVRALCAG